MNIMADIQGKLKAPKGQDNKFGGYKYRSCEDIVEAVKPLLVEHGAHLRISDEVVQLGERYYVKATASVKVGTETIEEVSGLARECLDRKGMDESQITGATSSYARKYALNGLFAIDDTKDADTMDNREHEHRFKKGEKEKYVTGIKNAAFNGDELGLRELWDELGKDAQLKIWPEFSSSERAGIKKLLEETA